MRNVQSLMVVLAGALFFSGTALGQEHSGFLGDNYAKLQDTQSASGVKVKRWIAPDVTPGKFEALLLDKTVFYPLPRGTDQLSTATLNEISAYLDEALRKELAGVVKLATEPGPKTLRFRPAITAVAAKSEGLKPYQYLPVAFVLTAGKKGSSASLAIEFDAQDTDTNQIVGAGMREGKGLELKSATEKLTLAHFKPAIDSWAKDMRAFIEAAKLKK